MKKFFLGILILMIHYFPMFGQVASASSCLQFDGVDDYVQVNSNVIPSSGDFTISFWAKSNSEDQGYFEIVSQNAINAWNHSNFYVGKLDNGNIRAGDDWPDTGVPFPTDGKWHYYTVVKHTTNYGNCKVYIDDTLKATSYYPIQNPEGTEFRIGKQYGGHGEHFNGQVDELRVWNYALTEDEIKERMNIALSCNENGLIYYWQFNEAGGSITQGVNGTIGNLYNMDNNSWVSSGADIKLFTYYKTIVTPMKNTVAVWGDYDNDGDLDILVSGDTGAGLTTQVYNNNNGNFNSINANLRGIIDHSATWNDYDNDGDLDIFLNGTTSYATDPTATVKMYRNDNGIFTEVSIGLPAIHYGNAAWGDYDNDGDQDLLLTGRVTYTYRFTRIYRNDKGIFRDINAGLPPLSSGSADWGDYDNDGDLDIILIGYNNMLDSEAITYIYNNNNGNFELFASPRGHYGGSAVWGDYNCDGNLDAVVTGKARYTLHNGGQDYIYGASSMICTNNDGAFTVDVRQLEDISNGTAEFGDYDNDGDMDIILAGKTWEGKIFSRIYQNDDSAFKIFNSGGEVEKYGNESGYWGDFDNDGDLDVLIAGCNQVILYKNNSLTSNDIPTTPTCLSNSLNVDNSVLLCWNKASDNQTPQNGLTYNLRVGTTPGGSEIMSVMSVAGIGNVNLNNKWGIKNLDPNKTYYWSVQTIDNCFKASQWAPEQHFNISTTTGKPIVSLGKISDPDLTSAKLHGVINTNNIETTYFFEYGTDPENLTHSTNPEILNGGYMSDSISASINNLACETIYYYRITSSNSEGTITSGVQSFFTDNSIPKSNLMIHLRADKGITLTNGKASKWEDLSNNNNHALQNNSAEMPVVILNEINYRPAVKFNGANIIQLPSAFELGIQNKNYEIFIVAKTASNNQQYILSGYSNFDYILNNVAGAYYYSIWPTYVPIGAMGDYADNKPHVFSCRASTGSLTICVDGINGSTKSGNFRSDYGGELVLGRRINNTYPFEGEIAEFLIYNRILSPEERDIVEQYLAGRYAMTSGDLPVELTSFIANIVDNKVQLTWETASEQNNYGFEIERKIVKETSTEYEKIGFIEGNGNSNSIKEYSFTDKSLHTGKVMYRLKQIDFDGKYEYSKEIEVAYDVPAEYSLEQNYPNPFNPTTKINFALAKKGRVVIDLYNSLGERIRRLFNEERDAGTYSIDFHGGGLASGIYLYTIKVNDYSACRKMILMK